MPRPAGREEQHSDGTTGLFPLPSIDTGGGEDLRRSCLGDYLLGHFGGVPQVLEGQVARRLLTVKPTTA